MAKILNIQAEWAVSWLPSWKISTSEGGGCAFCGQIRDKMIGAPAHIFIYMRTPIEISMPYGDSTNELKKGDTHRSIHALWG
ncbi:MAG: hypothetical protein JXA73_11455 [Acidobacteria bacterium]|nr:hypothetical protein [Acidobacteriota bacterium]